MESDPIPKSKPPFWQRALSTLALLLILALAAALRYQDPKSTADLQPWPDRAEYTIAGVNLLRHGSYHITINGVRYPPTYPFGYPLMLVPVYALFGADPMNAVYGDLAFSLLTIIFAFLIVRDVYGRDTALLATLLLAFSPLHVAASKGIGSENASMLLLAILAWSLMRIRQSTSRRRVYLVAGVAGWLAGFMASVRFSNVLIVGALVPSLWLLLSEQHPLRWKAMFWMGVGLVIGLAPTFIYNWTRFGGILHTGYEYWGHQTAWYRTLGLQYVKENLPLYLGVLRGKGKSPLLASSFALLPLIVGLASGLWKTTLHQKALTSLALGITLLNSAFYLFYFWHDSRFIALPAPFLHILVATGLVSLVHLIIHIRHHELVATAYTLVLIGWAILGTRDAIRWWTPAWSKSLLWQELMKRKSPPSASVYPALRDIDAHTEDDAYYITRVDAVYFNYYAIGDKKRVYVPIERREHAATPQGASWLVAAENEEEIRQLVEAGRPVYLISDELSHWITEYRSLKRRFPFTLAGQTAGVTLFRLHPSSWQSESATSRQEYCLPKSTLVQIPNAGFEHDNGSIGGEGTEAIASKRIPDGWGVMDWSESQPAVTIEQDRSWHVEGGASVRLDIQKEKPEMALYSSRFVLNKAHQISADVIVRWSHPDIPIGMTLAFYDAQGDQVSQAGDADLWQSTGEWAQLGLCTLVPRRAVSAEVYLTVIGSASVGESVWFDDLRVRAR